MVEAQYMNLVNSVQKIFCVTKVEAISIKEFFANKFGESTLTRLFPNPESAQTMFAVLRHWYFFSFNNYQTLEEAVSILVDNDSDSFRSMNHDIQKYKETVEDEIWSMSLADFVSVSLCASLEPQITQNESQVSFQEIFTEVSFEFFEEETKSLRASYVTCMTDKIKWRFDIENHLLLLKHVSITDETVLVAYNVPLDFAAKVSEKILHTSTLVKTWCKENVRQVQIGNQVCLHGIT